MCEWANVGVCLCIWVCESVPLQRNNQNICEIRRVNIYQNFLSRTTFMFMSAPHSTNSFVTSTCPYSAAKWRGVFEMIVNVSKTKDKFQNELPFNCDSHVHSANQKNGMNSQQSNKNNTQNLTCCIVVQNAFIMQIIHPLKI